MSRSTRMSRTGAERRGLGIPKSNWANPLDKPPFEAYAVTCGITFTFGGLKIDTSARVLDAEGAPIPGLTPPASWSAGSSTTTIPAARA